MPHTAEELWSKLGNKNFISLEIWPKFDAEKIDESLEYAESFTDNLLADVRYLNNILKIDKINKIIFIVSPVWRYKLYRDFNEIIVNTVEGGFSSIMKEIMRLLLPKYKEHTQEISKLLPKLIEKRPEIVLNKEKEIQILQEIKKNIEKEFNCKVVVEDGDKFKHEKSKFALPGKPAILLE